jgi:uncharacterized repeat protein (TIGR01451 family)
VNMRKGSRGTGGPRRLKVLASIAPIALVLVLLQPAQAALANERPDAVDDVYAGIQEDSSDNALDVLSNDSDADIGDVLAITAVDDPPNGTATIGDSTPLLPGGDVVLYTPDPDFNGAGMESFTYTIEDAGGATDTATIAVDVDERNDAPIAVDDLASLTEDTAGNQVDVLASDSPGPANESGQALTITNVTQPAHGTVVIADNGTPDPSDDVIEYTPEPNYSGDDAFDYTITDDGTTGSGPDPKSDDGTVSITVGPVNDDPTAVDDIAQVVEDSSNNPVDVLANDATPDAGEALTITSVSDPANGSAGIDDGGTPDPSDDLLRYAPDADVNGPDQFDYTVCDDGSPSACDTATVHVTVTAVNDPPVANADGPVSVEAGDSVAIDVVANDSPGPADEGGQTLSLSPTFPAEPAHGTVAVEGGQVRYTPDAGYDSGPDAFTYEVCDDGGTNGGSDTRCASAIVDIVVSPATESDVVISKAGPASVRAGDQFEYAITVDNLGPAAALDVQVSDELPPSMIFVSASGGGTFLPATNTVVWTLGTVAPPEAPIVLTLTVRAAPTRLTPYENTAQVALTNTDPNPANNTSNTIATSIVTRDVVFVSNRSGNADIWAMYADGAAAVNITANAACDRFPAWSPDGSKIAFASNRDRFGSSCGGNMEIYVMDADGTDVTRITTAPYSDVQPTWSPDGSRLAYSSQTRPSRFHLFTTASTGLGTPVKLTQKACNDASRGCSPDWSPDGSTLAFVRACAGLTGCPTTGEIYTMPANGGAATRLTNNAVDEGSPAWSPNGQRIMMHRFDGRDDEIAMMNANGTRQTFLTADPASDLDPAWVPGGARIAYATTRAGNNEIFVKNLAIPSDLVNLSRDLGADTDPDFRTP